LIKGICAENKSIEYLVSIFNKFLSIWLVCGFWSHKTVIE
jgi:hypothetical protein